jgi:hypothetical protein
LGYLFEAAPVVLADVQVLDLDFFRDPFPSYDVITMSMILHDWGQEKKRQLISKVRLAALAHFMHTAC